MLCKTKSSRPFETEPKNDFTPINPTNQSPIPKIRAIIGYFQSQKHVLLVWRRHTILTYHFTSLVISLCVLLYAWVLKTHWKKNTNLGPSHVQLNRLLCGICTNNIIKPISTLITSWLESSRRVFDRGHTAVMDCAIVASGIKTRHWADQCQHHVWKTHALWATSLALLSTWGYLALNAALVIQLSDCYGLLCM